MGDTILMGHHNREDWLAGTVGFEFLLVGALRSSNPLGSRSRLTPSSSPSHASKCKKDRRYWSGYRAVAYFSPVRRTCRTRCRFDYLQHSFLEVCLSAEERQRAGPLQVLYENPDEAVAFISELEKLNLSPGIVDPVLKIYLDAFRALFYVMTGLAGLGLLTSLFTDDLDLHRSDMGQQRFEQ